MNPKPDLTCPRCGAGNCRTSPWRSEAERQEHRGEQAYLCMNCVHRFYRAGGRRLLRDNPIVAAVGGGTLILMIAVITLLWVWKSGDRPGGHGPVPTASADGQPSAPTDDSAARP